MPTFVIETFVARPPEQVFAYLRDVSHEAVWQSAHVSEVIVEPPGPAKQGTLYHKIRRTRFGEQRFTEKITEMDESARRWSDLTLTGPFRGTIGNWQILSESDGATVHLSVEMHAPGLVRLLLPLIERTARRDLQSEFSKLKEILEGGGSGFLVGARVHGYLGLAAPAPRSRAASPYRSGTFALGQDLPTCDKRLIPVPRHRRPCGADAGRAGSAAGSAGESATLCPTPPP